MRVVSQKKDASYDFDRTEFRTSYECISATFDGRTFVIGKYATPERAAEVFMDMHKAYAPVQVVCTNMDEKKFSALVAASQNAPIRCVEMDDPRMAVTVFDSLVYYMPEKQIACIARLPNGKAPGFDPSIYRFESGTISFENGGKSC